MSSKSVEVIDLESPGPTVLRALRGLRFGSVEIVVHDGRVVQIERRERVRLDTAGDRPPDHRRRADRTPGGPETARAGETFE
jgi:hypothetical protein